MQLCDHDWQPGFAPARYRCTQCKALGYRGILNQSDTQDPKRASKIIPYACNVKDCNQPAIARKPKQLCATHRKR